MPIAPKIRQAMERSSWIRKMFEEGARLKAEFGAENVFDFSLGNPNLAPPEAFRQTLRELVVENLGLDLADAWVLLGRWHAGGAMQS